LKELNVAWKKEIGNIPFRTGKCVLKMFFDFRFSLSGLSFYGSDNFVNEICKCFAHPRAQHFPDSMITLTDYGSGIIIICR